MMPDPKLQGKIHVIGRSELQELERVNEAMDGAFWRAIEKKVRSMIESELNGMAASGDDREIARGQGAVRVLRRVLELPEIIRKESRAARES